ncbi:MAG: DinB family protein [Gemmataceae bacterium]
MTTADFETLLTFIRTKTKGLVDAVAALPDPAAALAWQPGPGRANIGWQLLHIAATDDRHLNARMNLGEPANPDLVKRYAGGSTPDQNLPSLAEITAYLDERRAAMLAHLRSLKDSDLANKPNDKAPWVYNEWFQVLAWHEAHHHGQAHLTLNLFKNKT